MTINHFHQIFTILSIIAGIFILKVRMPDFILRYKYRYEIISLLFFVIPVYGIIKNFTDDKIIRFSGLIGDRVFEADLCAVLIIFYIYIFFTKDKNIAKYIMLFLILVTLIYFLQLRTLTAYISLSAGIITFLFILKSKKLINKKSISLLLFIILLSFTISEVFFSGINPERKNLISMVSDTNQYNRSTESRQYFYKASIEMVSEHPLKGVGAGKWGVYFPIYSPEYFTDEKVDMNIGVFAHNDFLQTMAEFGIKGILYLLIFLTAIYMAIKKSKKDFNYSYLPAILVAFFLSSSLNSVIYNEYNFLILCVLFGMAFKSYIKRKRVIFFILFALVLLFFAVSNIFYYSYQKTYLQAITYKRQGNAIEMLRVLNTIPEIYNTDMNGIPIDYYKGIGYFNQRDFINARKKFEEALQLNPYYPIIMENYYAVLYLTGDKEEAIKKLQEMKSIFPNFYEPQINLLVIYFNSGNTDEAKKLINELLVKMKYYEIPYVKNYKVFEGIKKQIFSIQN